MACAKNKIPYPARDMVYGHQWLLIFKVEKRCGEIPLTIGWQNRDDVLAFAQFFGHLDGRFDCSTGRAASEDTFFCRHFARSFPCGIVAHCYDFIVDFSIQCARHKTGTETLDFMGSRLPAAQYGRIFRLKRIDRSEEHTSELQSRFDLVCRLLLE